MHELLLNEEIINSVKKEATHLVSELMQDEFFEKKNWYAYFQNIDLEGIRLRIN